MRRALPALGLTAAGVVLVLNFDTRATDQLGLAAAAPSAVAAPSAAAPSGAAPSATAPSAAAPSTTAPSGTSGTQVVDGAVADTRFGPYQVEATVSDGKLVDVTLIDYPTDRRSMSIASYAEPILRQAALASQSADLDVVSGATLTSRAYAASLQATLDAAGL